MAEKGTNWVVWIVGIFIFMVVAGGIISCNDAAEKERAAQEAARQKANQDANNVAIGLLTVVGVATAASIDADNRREREAEAQRRNNQRPIIIHNDNRRLDVTTVY